MSRIYTTEGIVLRTIKYGESSLISDVFTKDKGLRTYILSGVRQKRGSKANVLHPMNHVELVAYHAEEDKIARIKEIRYASLFDRINQDVVISAVGSFMVEVSRKSIVEREPNPELFDFLLSSFQHLDESRTGLKILHIRFLIALANRLGFGLLNNYGPDRTVFNMEEGLFVSKDGGRGLSILGEHAANLSLLIEGSEQTDFQLSISNEVRDTLLDQLLVFYRLHVPAFNKVKSLDILRVILS